MKRLFCFFGLMLTIAGLGYGLFGSARWEHWNALEQRRWLEDFLKHRGYVVIWKQNTSITMEQFQLRKPEVITEELYQVNFERLLESNIILFYERKTDIFFVFGQRVYSLPQQQGTAPSNSTNTIHLSVLAVDQVGLNPHGGGEFTLSDYEEVKRLFPFGEVKALGARPWNILYAFGIAEVAVCFCWMFMGYTAKRHRQLAQLPKMPMVVARGPVQRPTKTPTQQMEARSYRPPTKPLPSVVQEDIDALRLRVINTLDGLIATHEGESRDCFLSMRLEAQGEKRTTRLRYVLTHRIPSILEQNFGVDRVEEEDIDMPPTSIPIEVGTRDIRPALPLDHLVPSEISLPCVKAILWVLLGTGAKTPFIGQHRFRYDNLEQLVMHKGFRVEEWRAAFGWLHQKGVLLYVNPHRKGFSCSINPKRRKTFPPGDEIIGILVAMKRQLKR